MMTRSDNEDETIEITIAEDLYLFIFIIHFIFRSGKVQKSCPRLLLQARQGFAEYLQGARVIGCGRVYPGSLDPPGPHESFAPRLTSPKYFLT